MSPVVKTEKFPDVRVSPKLKAETERAAEIEQENLSEYIRKAVEQRNERVRQISEGDRFINRHTGEEYTAVKVRTEDDVIVGENKRERRAFGKNLTYNKNDLKKI